ncbi:glutamyl-tRNA reductase [Actomonas aquatica]|uniref:Glutamyl-tRNA reductase n=1 Tax=Actomonas aquatica TaxID=2866162 RepID=A0ABZ1CC62_9BACT|nr:glutamyl-tRNA reductase [Opitutus sp. WL0086]WRQ89261.1 glutamyl-tRNA reductase [Opitutus sp. WL0086]
MSAPGATLFVVGANHHTTPLEWREKLALGPEKLPAFAAELRAQPDLPEFAVLNTCNRIEFYGVAESPAAIEALAARFCAAQGIAPSEFATIRALATGPDAIRHLVKVSSGLDSQLLGENEIFGQVKDAYAAAQSAQTTGPVLNRMFQKAFQAAKYVRTHTAINEGQVSTANVAVELARTIFGELDDARVLAIGAGEIGEQTTKAFQSRGARHVTVASRTLERAMELATRLGAAALPYEQIEANLADFDIVCCATAAPGAILTAATIQAAMRRRRAEPLFLIDLALPRDVDPTAADLEGVYLYNLDDLAKIAEENRLARVAEVERAESIIAEKTAHLWQALRPQVPGGSPPVPTDS